jgi:integrase
VRNIHVLVSKVLSDAMDEGKVARNVARQAKPPKVAKKELMIWTKEEMNIFLGSVNEDRLFALWRLACRTGMRRGELAALRWIDVDLEAGELSIRQNLVIVRTKATIQEPKTPRSKRTIALDDATVEALRVHRRQQLEERLAWGEAWTDSGLVFVREGGESIYPDLISHWFARRRSTPGCR